MPLIIKSSEIALFFSVCGSALLFKNVWKLRIVGDYMEVNF